MNHGTPAKSVTSLEEPLSRGMAGTARQSQPDSSTRESSPLGALPQRAATPRARRGVLRIAENEAWVTSTQPAMPRVLIRRHEPRDSPSWTREAGPTDATTRALPRASARTMTHCVATMLTHRDDGRDLGGRVVDSAGLGLTTGVDAVMGSGAACGIAASLAVAGVDGAGTETSERTAFPTASVVSRAATVSGGAVAVTRAMVSAGAALCFDGTDSREREAPAGRGSRTCEPSHAAAMSTAATNHLAVLEVGFRGFSAVSVVPHHLHERTCAG